MDDPRALATRRRRLLLALAAAGATLTGCGDGEPAAPPAAGATDAASAAWFTDEAAARGIRFEIDRAVGDDYFMPDSVSAGGAVLDYDGDGDLDVLVLNGFRRPEGDAVTPAGADRLYRQEPGGRFTDVSAAAGLAHEGYGMGVAAGDMDNDGDVDLYVTCYGPDLLYRNEGNGSFADVTDAAGIDNAAWGSSATFFDADGDGFLDLYVVNYVVYDPSRKTYDAGGAETYATPTIFDGTRDVLYRNDGDGTFTDVSVAAGIAGTPGKGLGVLATDLDGDGRQDLYVANDTEPNFAWIADGAGAYAEQALVMGLAVNGFGRPEASMGIAHGDVDGDGHADLFLTHLVSETNTLYRGRGGGGFDDATAVSGLGAASLDYTAFGTALIDVDLDGDLDLVAVNGRVVRRRPHPASRLTGRWKPYAEPNQLFLNDGTGRFSEAGATGGAFCADVEVSRGLATGDLDGDGDLDLVVTNGNGTVRLYRNDAPRSGSWLLVRAFDPTLRRDAIGAVVEVRAGDRAWSRLVTATDSYLSSRDPRAHFGLGPVSAYDEIVVQWPWGERERFPGGPANCVVEVRRGEGEPPPRSG